MAWLHSRQNSATTEGGLSCLPGPGEANSCNVPDKLNTRDGMRLPPGACAGPVTNTQWPSRHCILWGRLSSLPEPTGRLESLPHRV